jgi:hypothetical protein
MTHRPTGPKSNIVIVFENVLNKNSQSSLTTLVKRRHRAKRLSVTQRVMSASSKAPMYFYAQEARFSLEQAIRWIVAGMTG